MVRDAKLNNPPEILRRNVEDFVYDTSDIVLSWVTLLLKATERKEP